MSGRRILHITTLLQGGAGRIVAELAVAQQRAGHQVAVACAADDAPGYAHYAAWLERLADHHIPVLPVSCTFRRSLHHLMSAVETLDRSTFVTGGLDLVHAHAAVPALVAGTLRPGVPVVATMHGWNAQKAPEHAATDVAVFNRLPVVAVPSRAAATHLRDAGVEAERLTVVPYGVAPQEAVGLTREEEIVLRRWRSAGRLVAVCVGSVGTRKRQSVVLEALAAPGLRDRVSCAFLGEGPELPAHQARAEALGLAGTTAFLGYRPNVTDWLQAADVALFPSQREGLPLALLEAAALRVCAIASDIDEHRVVLTHGASGLLYDTHEPHGLVAALECAVGMGAEARRTLASNAHAVWATGHRPRQMLVKYEELYTAVSVATLVPARHGLP